MDRHKKRGCRKDSLSKTFNLSDIRIYTFSNEKKNDALVARQTGAQQEHSSSSLHCYDILLLLFLLLLLLFTLHYGTTNTILQYHTVWSTATTIVPIVFCHQSAKRQGKAWEKESSSSSSLAVSRCTAYRKPKPTSAESKQEVLCHCSSDRFGTKHSFFIQFNQIQFNHNRQ